MIESRVVMKIKKIYILAFVLAIMFPCLVSNAQGLEPKLVIDEPVYVFDPVPEGEHVSHVFILRNTSDKVIRITKVQPP